jgi:hypothetical protein
MSETTKQDPNSLVGRQLVALCDDGAFRKCTIINPDEGNNPTGANAVATYSGKYVYGVFDWNGTFRTFRRL